MSLQFDLSIKKVYWNGKRFPSVREKEAEAVRLYIEIIGNPEKTIVNAAGDIVTIPERKGVNVNTASFQDLVKFLNDNSIKKSESVRSVVRRMMFLRFPTEFISNIRNVSENVANEYREISLRAISSVEWIGECGYRQTVRLDGRIDVPISEYKQSILRRILNSMT